MKYRLRVTGKSEYCRRSEHFEPEGGELVYEIETDEVDNSLLEELTEGEAWNSVDGDDKDIETEFEYEIEEIEEEDSEEDEDSEDSEDSEDDDDSEEEETES